ncbi:hypothetical protein LguiA_028517 [Lonicera macranthoides]
MASTGAPGRKPRNGIYLEKKHKPNRQATWKEESNKKKPKQKTAAHEHFSYTRSGIQLEKLECLTSETTIGTKREICKSMSQFVAFPRDNESRQNSNPNVREPSKLGIQSFISNFYCFCGVPAPIMTVWTNDNPGRRFVGCGNYKIKLFDWVDGKKLHND